MSEHSAPSAVIRIGERLIDAGRTAFLVGPGLRDLLSGMRPAQFEVSTNASHSELLELFPNGVWIARQRVMVHTVAGPVDVMPFRAGAQLECDLAHRDFTINAIAYDIADQKWIDPHGGRADLESGVIRAVGCAQDRIDEDPIRALRGIRLAATRGWEIDSELEFAFGRARATLESVPRELVRRELIAILLSPDVARALERLDRSGIGSQLAPGVGADAGAVLDRLPRDLELRLAGWLRGARARSVLQRLRFSRPSIDRVELLLRYDQADRASAMNASGALRFARRAGAPVLGALIALRKAEIEAACDAPEAARVALQRLRASLVALRDFERTVLARRRLAITGAEVMECLGCEPGPHVGRAIDLLAERIDVDPELNTPSALRDLLRSWSEKSG